MFRTYTDYVNKTAITIPDKFIDVKTGASHTVSPIIQEQIEYHSKNNTLIHLVLSSLYCYLHPKTINEGSNQILLDEINEIKRMLQSVHIPLNHHSMAESHFKQKSESLPIDIKEVEDVLEAFGG